MGRVQADISRQQQSIEGGTGPVKVPAFGGIGWRWPVVGFLGSAGMALTGVNASGAGAGSWWFGFSLPNLAGGHLATLAAFYLGMFMLSVAWLGVGADLGRHPHRSTRSLWALGALWATPLMAGPVLFSRDIFSYAAQGALAHLRLSPYSYGTFVLGAVGQGHLAGTVAPVWRATPAPYGPMFLVLAGLVMGAAGSHLVVAILGLRLIDLAGLVLVGAFLPRLAAKMGADPVRALWLGLLSPVVLLNFISAGHNDILMIGLMLAGVTLAMEDRPLLGVALCAVAAAVKVPALAGVVFIAVGWARRQPTGEAKARVLALSGATFIAVVTVLTEVAGLGWGWLALGTLATPGDVYLAMTPATAFGDSLATVLHVLGVGASTSTVVAGLRALGGLVAIGVGAVLLWRSRLERLALPLGLALLVVTVSGPVTWPWYLAWGLVLLAACTAGQRSGLMIAVCGGVGFVVAPSGNALLPTSLAIPIALAMAVGATLAWRRHRPAIAALLGTGVGAGTGPGTGTSAGSLGPALPIGLAGPWPFPHIPFTHRAAGQAIIMAPQPLAPKSVPSSSHENHGFGQTPSALLGHGSGERERTASTHEDPRAGR